MIELDIQIQQVLIFVGSGILGMLYAYCWKWVELKDSPSLFIYLFGNKKETLKVLLVFISTAVGTIGLDYLSNLSIFQIILAGGGLGLLIPQKVSEKESNLEKGNLKND